MKFSNIQSLTTPLEGVLDSSVARGPQSGLSVVHRQSGSQCEGYSPSEQAQDMAEEVILCRSDLGCLEPVAETHTELTNEAHDDICESAPVAKAVGTHAVCDTPLQLQFTRCRPEQASEKDNFISSEPVEDRAQWRSQEDMEEADHDQYDSSIDLSSSGFKLGDMETEAMLSGTTDVFRRAANQFDALCLPATRVASRLDYTRDQSIPGPVLFLGRIPLTTIETFDIAYNPTMPPRVSMADLEELESHCSYRRDDLDIARNCEQERMYESDAFVEPPLFWRRFKLH